MISVHDFLHSSDVRANVCMMQKASQPHSPSIDHPDQHNTNEKKKNKRKSHTRRTIHIGMYPRIVRNKKSSELPCDDPTRLCVVASRLVYSLAVSLC